MPKKKETAIVKAIPVLSAETIAYRAREAADAAWTKATDTASRDYGTATSMAWQRYATALHEDLKVNPKAKTAGKDYDKKYDQERESALAQYHKSCAKADAELQKALK